jgi:hypothetical protein
MHVSLGLVVTRVCLLSALSLVPALARGEQSARPKATPTPATKAPE